MAIEIIWLLPVAVVFFAAGWFIWFRKLSDKVDIMGAEIALLNSELRGQKLARKEQTRRYDELYDAFLRVNQYNTELQKQNFSLKNTYEECADEIYAQFLAWKSRQELCQLYPKVAYSTLCNWIRRKRKEALSSEVNPNDSVQWKLL